MGRKLSQLSFANTNGAELTSTLRRRERTKRPLSQDESRTLYSKGSYRKNRLCTPVCPAPEPFFTTRTNIHVAPTTFPEVISETICQGSSLRVTTIQWGLARPSQAF
ncbi:hypothetical protein FOXYSP1_12798 [Fusarium oxysporum f. sp. phaseoli]